MPFEHIVFDVDEADAQSIATTWSHTTPNDDTSTSLQYSTYSQDSTRAPIEDNSSISASSNNSIELREDTTNFENDENISAPHNIENSHAHQN